MRGGGTGEVAEGEQDVEGVGKGEEETHDEVS